jgi:hypothetical protein
MHRLVLAVCANAIPGHEMIRSLPVQPILAVLSGASGLIVLYTGLGYWLVRRFRTRAAWILRRLESDRLLDDDRLAVSGWTWYLPRFTSVF